MKRQIFILTIGCTVIIVAGCGMLPISDEEIKTTAETAGNITETVARPAISTWAPGLGGLAGIVGAAVAIGVRAGLKALQRKKDDHIREVAKGEG